MSTSATALKAADVRDALHRRHSLRAGEWVCIPEAFSGYNTASGGIDLLAVGAWRSAKAKGLPGAGNTGKMNVVVAYEIKVSRADFRRDLYGYAPQPGTRGHRFHRSVEPWPAKQYDALRLTNYFMFAVPRGLLHDDEIERREPWRAGDLLGEPPRRGALYLPAEVGLLEVDERGHCRVRADAPYRERDEWPTPLAFELIRRAQYLGAWWAAGSVQSGDDA